MQLTIKSHVNWYVFCNPTYIVRRIVLVSFPYILEHYLNNTSLPDVIHLHLLYKTCLPSMVQYMLNAFMNNSETSLSLLLSLFIEFKALIT